MGLLILVIAGGIIGWLAAVVLDLDDRLEISLNIGVGIVGALLAALAVGGIAIFDGLALSALLVSFLGAIVFVMVVHLFRRRVVV